MKQCPRCKNTYTDVTLRFCLADGVALTDLSGAPPTVNMQGAASTAETIAMNRGEQMRVDIPQQTYQQAALPTKSSSGGIFKIILVLIGLGIFVVVAIGVGWLIYINSSSSETGLNMANKDVKTSASPSPSPDDKDELRDQIANLEKLIKEQKNGKQPVNIPFTDKTGSTRTARANSPGDGFLALRNLPSSDVGERIVKIPHGATISVGTCGPAVKSIHPGRWCQASYDGYTGWVYDYYVIY